MNGNHKIRTLGVHTRFDSETVAMERQKALTVFAGDRLPRIMEEVFNAHSRPGLIRRFGRVELDLCVIPGDEFPDGIEERLRQKLEDFLDNHPVLPEPVLSAGSSRQLASGLAEEETILYFLENGRLPWHGSFSNVGDMVASLETRLETGAVSFINCLKDAPDMKNMVKRLTRQFPEAIIEKILERAVPGRGRLTREVIRRLDAFYAVGTGGQAGKDSSKRLDIVQNIKNHVWEHMLLITLGGAGIFPKLLKLVLPQHASPEARQKIFRILRHLPGSSAVALAGVDPLHPDTSPISPSFWAEKIQNAFQKSGRKSDRVADPDFPRIRREDILRGFGSLVDDTQDKLETALRPSPVPMSVQREKIGRERELHQVITNRSLSNGGPGKHISEGQMVSPAKGKPVKESSRKEVANGADESDDRAWAKVGNTISRNEITKDRVDTGVVGSSMENIVRPSHVDSRGENLDSYLLDEAVPSTTVQKDDATERPELFQSGAGRHSFWSETIQAALQKSGRKSGRVADLGFPRIGREDILRGFDSLADDIQVKLEMALKPYPVPVSVQQEDTIGDREPHQAITNRPLGNGPGKHTSEDQIVSPARGKSVRKFSGEEAANGADESDNRVRAKAGNTTLSNEITKGRTDTVMTGPSMENIAGPSHGDCWDGNLNSGLLDEAVPSPTVQKDEITENPVLFQSDVGSPFVRCGETGYKVYLQWIQRLLDCLGGMADEDASACPTGDALSVIGDMIFEAAASTPEPEMLLAELSSMVAEQMTGGTTSSKKTGRMSVNALTGKFLYGVDPLKAKVHGDDRPDEPVSAFSRNFAGKALENLRMGTLWQIILSETWSRILTSGLSPGFSEPDSTSDKKASYLAVMDSVLALSPEKREPFLIRVLFRFAERMQLPIAPFPDLPGPEAQSRAADKPKAGKTIFKAPETDMDSGPALGQALNFRKADRLLPDPGQEAGNAPLDSKHSIRTLFEKWSELFQNPAVQKNIRSTLNLEEVWGVVQVILHWKIRERGLETDWEKLKSDACVQLRKSPDDKQDDDRDLLAGKLSLILKSGPDPKAFLLRILTGLVSGDPHQEHGSGENPNSSVPGHRKLGHPPAENNLEKVGDSRPTGKPSGDPRVTAMGTHSAVASRKWDSKSEPIFVENAGMVLAGPYLSMLFNKLDLLEDKAFKSRYAAEKAVHILEYMVTGEQSAPEYRLMLNKLLCGMEPDRPIHQLFLLEKAQTDLTRELILSMIAHWKVLGKTSVEGFRQSFLTREGRLEATEDAWSLVVAPKPFDMLLDRIPWTFSPIRLPWMDRVLHVHWR
ncbi:contractile injection system tape measure protein [Desulfobacter curvatus]|uniref:contractile injection system tape measure protein n=1 Tax=Desulfobacter curvatus TaxID=2290 RepID=UPI00036FA917|nr:contractile injection system tape measure protein [Desulfobacter curvatus]